MTSVCDLERNDPRMKCVKPAIYVWYDNNDDWCGWVEDTPAEYVFEE